MSEKPLTNTVNKSPKESSFLSIQEILSVGYILLIIIGMFLEYIKYNVFGINIIEHSDFADFLIAPFKNPVLIGFPVFGGLLVLFVNYFFEKRNYHKKKILDEENKILQNLDSKNTLSAPPSLNYQSYIVWLILLFISVNIGFGAGGYFNNYSRMEKHLDAQITNAKVKFIDGTDKEIYLLGKNTSNLFYFENNKIDLIVCPIPGNVKTIKYIPKAQQKQLEKD